MICGGVLYMGYEGSSNFKSVQQKYKKSLIAGITLATFGSALVLYSDTIHASTAESQTTVVNDTSGSKNINNDSTVSNSEVNSGAVSTTSGTSSNVQSTDNEHESTQATGDSIEERIEQPNVTSSDESNQGNLDNFSISGTQVNVSGWHATNYADGRNNNFIIVYDATAKTEITRKQVGSVERNDVAEALPNVKNSIDSGFSTSFDFTDDMNDDEIQIISRYSASSDGNQDYVDYWFSPVVFNKSNARLDGATLSESGTSISVNGWFASDDSVGKNDKYLILYDKTTGLQVSQTAITELKRTDIKQVYSGIYDSDNSGFSGILDLNGANITDQLALVVRYSNSSKGNGDQGTYIDYWLDLPVYRDGNFANLDNFSFNGESTINISGWHATNESIGKNNHFIILYDETSGKQVYQIDASSVKRTDVANTYSNIINASSSGFEAQIAFNPNWIGHKLVVVDRYSTSSEGNGNNGNYVDYWFDSKTFESSAYHIDDFSKNNLEYTSIHLSGWFTSNEAIGKDYATVIALDADSGKEITRQNIDLYQRQDVKNANPDYYNSSNSGFTVDLTSNSFFAGQNLIFVLRYSPTSNSESNYSDIYTGSYTIVNQNKGSFDNITVNDNDVYISGWHASDASFGKNYEYIIAVDLNGNELGRVLVSDSKTSRPDVYAQNPDIYGSSNSGFSTSFPLLASMDNRYVRFIDRLSSDESGNSNYVDYYSNTVRINITSNVQANAINAYIVNNDLQHAGIQTSIWSGYPTDDMSYRYGRPEGVVVHETANPNDSVAGEINYAQNHYENAFVHSYVSDNQIVNVANTNLKCWGSGYYGNQRFIQFETIEVHTQYAFAAELNNAAYYTAYLLKEYNLAPSLADGNGGTVWSHHDVTNYLGGTDHTDPDGYWAKNASQFFGTTYTMSDFIELVGYYYAQV